MHERVATLTGDLDTMIAGFTVPADAYEVRLDSLWADVPHEDAAAEDLLQLVEAAAGRQLIATLRPIRQGGAFEGPEEVRIGLLVAAARAGFHHIDLEADLGGLPHVVGALRREAQIWISDHGQGPPARDPGLRTLQAMQDLQVARQKLAYPSGSYLDELRSLELAHAHAQRNGDPAIMPMGASASLRALLAIAGNQATYGHAGQPAFSGQPALSDVQAVWDHWGLRPDDLGGRDGWFAVLGDPVAHSLSPRIHNAMLRHAGRAERFGAMRVPDSIGAFRLTCSVASRIGLRGASVTMPHKLHAAQACDGDETVQATGAANCIRFDGPSVPPATNTDAHALRELLADSSHVAVLGAGGAARAAIWAARQHGHDVSLVARPGATTDATAQTFELAPVWDRRHELIADTWVQATPIGPGQPAPVKPRGVNHAIELVYADQPTAFETAARIDGARVTDGRAFLVAQAIHAYRFWTGQDPEPPVMEAAL